MLVRGRRAVLANGFTYTGIDLAFVERSLARIQPPAPARGRLPTIVDLDGDGDLDLVQATAGGVRGTFARAIPEYGLSEGELWRHSVGSALAAESAQSFCDVPLPPETYAAALLHDTGKLAVPEHILNKPGKLTTLEFEPGVVEDVQKALDVVAPADRFYQHNVNLGDGNGHSHVRAGLVGPSLTVPSLRPV